MGKQLVRRDSDSEAAIETHVDVSSLAVKGLPKSKAKAKAKAKSKSSTSKPGQASKASKEKAGRSSVENPSGSASSGASVLGKKSAVSAKTTGSVSLSPSDKYGSKIRAWIDQIVLTDILEEKKLGREINNAGQTLQAMEGDVGITSDGVILKAHLDAGQPGQGTSTST